MHGKAALFVGGDGGLPIHCKRLDQLFLVWLYFFVELLVSYAFAGVHGDLVVAAILEVGTLVVELMPRERQDLRRLLVVFTPQTHIVNE